MQSNQAHFNEIIIANEGFNEKSGLEKIRSGNADMISFGKLYISNPDQHKESHKDMQSMQIGI